MDLQKFDGKSDEGAGMIVAHPGTGEPTDIVITLAGHDSRAWRLANHKLASRMLTSKDSRDNLAEMFDEREANTAGMLASVTLSWENVKEDGKVLPCTHENAKKLYAKYPWLAEQADRFVGNRAHFFRSVKADVVRGGEVENAAAATAEERQE